jgi:hypothetical protein
MPSSVPLIQFRLKPEEWRQLEQKAKPLSVNVYVQQLVRDHLSGASLGAPVVESATGNDQSLSESDTEVSLSPAWSEAEALFRAVHREQQVWWNRREQVYLPPTRELDAEWVAAHEWELVVATDDG